jgi:hypothetical protein
MVLAGDAEGVADHHQRQPGGDVGDEVAAALLADGVDEAVDDGPHLVALVAHPPGGEALVDELAPPQVGGVVHVDHHRDRPGVGPDAAGVGERLGLARDRPDVVVAGDPPDPGDLVEGDGVVVPAPGQARVGIVAPELTSGEADLRCGHSQALQHG